jgi:outer membrane protein assembly factor BamB
MPEPHRLAAVLLLAAALLPTAGPRPAGAVPAPPPLPGTGWPMHGGTPARNMVNLEDRGAPEFWSVEPGKERNLKWVAPLGSRCYTSPVVVNGRVFIGTNNENPRNPRDRGKPTADEPKGPPTDRGILMCFGAKDGKFRWQAVHDKLASGIVNDWPHEGIASTPAVDGDRVYYVSNRAEVVCADADGFLDGSNDGFQGEQYRDETDADIIWRFDMIAVVEVFPHNLAACSPLLVGDRLFVVTGNGVDEAHVNLPSPKAPSFIALDKTTGKLLWQSNLPGKNVMHGQWSSPAYGVFKGVPAVIFPGGDGWVYGLKPETGALLWKFDANPKDAKYELGGRGSKSDFIGMPVVYKEKVYIATGQDPEHSGGVGHFWCIDPAGKTGDISPGLVIDAGADPPKTGPNSNSGAVWHYGGEEKRPFAVRDYVFGRTLSTACIVDDVLYIAEMDGYLHCLDAKTGRKFWQYDFQSSVWGSAYYVDGKVYVGNDDGDLFVFKHDPKPDVLDEVAEAAKEPNEKAAKLRRKAVRALVARRSLLAKIDMNAPIRSTPTVVGGVLYITTENKLYAIEAGK